MGKPASQLVKATLDKDLDKFTHVEDAMHQFTQRFAAPGIGLLFLVMAMIFAGVYVFDRPGATIIVAAAAVASYMAMNVGAKDVTNNVGAAVGARAMSMTFALILAAVCEIAGAMIAGSDVVTTISRGIVDPGRMPGPETIIWVMMAALVSAALWINLATWLKAPVSTTHAIVGAVLGAGIASSGAGAIHWGAFVRIAGAWLVTPVLGGLVAACFLAFIKEFIIYRPDKIASARTWVPVLIGIMSGTFAAYLILRGLKNVIHISLISTLLTGVGIGILAWLASIPYVRRQAVGLENRNQSLRTLFRLPLIFSAALLSFAHGANDVANAIGPLSGIVQAAQSNVLGTLVVVPLWVSVIGALGLSAGILLFGPRLIRLVGQEITKLNPMRAYCVALSAAFTVILASWLGLPVSSTHITVGAVFGVGFFREWYTRHSRRRRIYMRETAGQRGRDETYEDNLDETRRRHLVRRSHFMTIAAAWIITVPATVALAAVVYLAMVALFI